MLKLKRLQEEKKKAAEGAAAASTAAAPTNAAAAAPASSSEDGEQQPAAGSTPGGYVLKRTNSKELLKNRKSKSKENVFSLRTNKGRGGKKTKAAEIRAHKDVTEMDQIPGIDVDFPDTNNLMHFLAKVTPSDGLYKGATFQFTVDIPQTYPYDPPKVTCNTLLYHPNIDWEGHVCLNILRADWMPVLNLGSVLFGLMTLFLEPNPDDPLNKEAAQLMVDRPQEFERNVKESLRGGRVAGRQFPKLL
ncbi:NEDD8-conjugating enzyme Ubc12 [Balamuthia mandrillaris]